MGFIVPVVDVVTIEVVNVYRRRDGVLSKAGLSKRTERDSYERPFPVRE
jgi:hypothetical protein